jgi:hypothetical protein
MEHFGVEMDGMAQMLREHLADLWRCRLRQGSGSVPNGRFSVTQQISRVDWIATEMGHGLVLLSGHMRTRPERIHQLANASLSGGDAVVVQRAQVRIPDFTHCLLLPDQAIGMKSK